MEMPAEHDRTLGEIAVKRILHHRALIQYGLALVLPISAAHAQEQTVSPPAPAGTPSQSDTPPTAGTASEGGAAGQTGATATATADTQGGVSDIVVTAERRSVSLQKAPAAITVVDQAALTSRGIQDIRQAQVLLPSARISKTASSTAIFIRGVGQKIDAPNTEALTVVNMNGAGVLREALSGSNLYDVSRIEALPGPQGTLYGSAAVGGVINIEFQRPEYKWAEEFEGEKGNYDSTRLMGVVNAPLGNAAGVRLAVNYDKADAYFKSGAGALDDLSARLSGKADLSDRLSLFVWGMYSQVRGTTPNNILFPYQNPANIYDDTKPAPGPIAPFAGDDHSTLYLASGQLAYNGDNFTVTYIPAYAKFDSHSSFYAAGASFSIFEHVRQESNELRFTNDTTSRLKLIGGLYQSRQKYLDYLADSSRGQNFNVPYSRLSSVSAYAQGTYDLTDTLRFTVGGRYGINKRFALVNEIIPRTPLRPFTFSNKYHHADWKVGTEYDLTPNTLLYGVVQTGYVPGTYSATPSEPSQSALLKSSKLQAYTAGIKNRLFDRKVTFNLEGFYYDYKNLQVTNLNTFLRVNEFFNAQRIKIYGAQLDTTIAVAKLTEVHATFGYLHARNSKFIVPAAAPATGFLDYSGLTPVFSPKWSVNVGASHSVELNNASKLTFRVDSHYESFTWGAFEHRPGTSDVGLSTRNPGFTKTDLTLTYFAPDDHWHIGGYVRNVENTAHFASLSGVNATIGNGFLERPRTYGVNAGVKF